MSHIGAIFKNLRELQINGTIKDHEFALVYLRQLMSILSFLIKIFVKEIETEDIYLVRRLYHSSYCRTESTIIVNLLFAITSTSDY